MSTRSLFMMMLIVVGALCMVMFSPAAAAVNSTDLPPLCFMGTCQCIKHKEDDTIATLRCMNMNLTKIPNLKSFYNLTQL